MSNKQLKGVKSGWSRTLLISTAVLGSLLWANVPQQVKADTTSATTTTTATTQSVQNGETSGTETTTPTTTTPTTTPTTTNTDNLTATTKNLQTSVDTAKSTGVIVTENDPKTITTTQEGLASTVAEVESENATQIDAINAATAKQEENNTAYATAKAAYDNKTVTITTNSSDDWTDEALIKFLGGGDSATAETASDEAKKVADITFNKGATLIDATNKSLEDGNLPTWTYKNAFKDPQTGRMIDVVESITSYTPALGNNNSYIDTTSDQIGFTPHNVQDISASVKYYFDDTGEAATIDLIAGFSDLDGNQGIKVTNGYDSIIHGSNVHAQEDGSYRNYNNATLNSDNPSGQAWVLQKGVSETDYTFYVGLNDDGTVNNDKPIQYIGGAAFSVAIPTSPTLAQEAVSYTPTVIQMTTNYEVTYDGAGDQTPVTTDTPVTWTGSYDANSSTFIWTPSTTTISTPTPRIDGYAADVVKNTVTLTPTSTDPQDQSTSTVQYYRVSIPGATDAGSLTVSYQDQYGQTLKQDSVHQGYVGNSYSITQTPIDGYVIIGHSGDLSGTLTATPQNIILIYAPIVQETTPQDSGSLTINYVDENGNSIAASVTKTASIGNGYQVAQPDISGYTFVKVETGSSAQSGTFTTDDQVITYVYQKNMVSVPNGNQGTTNTPTTDNTTGNTSVATPITTSDETGTPEQGDTEIATDSASDSAPAKGVKQSGTSTTIRSSQKADLSHTTVASASSQTATWSLGTSAKTSGQFGNNQQKASNQQTLPQTSDAQESGALGLLGLLAGIFGLAVTRKRKQQ